MLLHLPSRLRAAIPARQLFLNRASDKRGQHLISRTDISSASLKTGLYRSTAGGHFQPEAAASGVFPDTAGQQDSCLRRSGQSCCPSYSILPSSVFRKHPHQFCESVPHPRLSPSELRASDPEPRDQSPAVCSFSACGQSCSGCYPPAGFPD